MKICWRDQRTNGERLAAALRAAGHDLVEDAGDVLLIDHDALHLEPYASLLRTHPRAFLHPHGAGFVSSWIEPTDWPIHPHTRGMFVHGPGHVDLLNRCGYLLPVEAIGWTFSDLAPFRPCPTPIRILLAPQHAMASGHLDPALREENRRIHDLLCALPVELTVRFVGPFEPLGIVRHSKVTYVDGGAGTPQSAVEALETVDCVIGAAWTFPCLAIARGVPTILYGQHGYRNAPIQTRPPWQETTDLERYPFDAGDAPFRASLYDLIHLACSDLAAILPWRERFIGEAFDPARFVAQFERAVASW